MKRFLKFTLIALVVVACTSGTSPNLATQKAKSYVYICVSPTAYVYHSSPNCHGLNRCTHPIIRTTLDSAVNYYHRRPCKICE